MNILQIIAHPDLSEKSFTGQIAEQFRLGAWRGGHVIKYKNLYSEHYKNIDSTVEHQTDVSEADHICFVWPCWWEMPPAILVDFLQKVFVKGFAFDVKDGKMVPKIKKTVSCFIIMGQKKFFDPSYIKEAMLYCGLTPTFIICNGVNEHLSSTQAKLYLAGAFTSGTFCAAL